MAFSQKPKLGLARFKRAAKLVQMAQGVIANPNTLSYKAVRRCACFDTLAPARGSHVATRRPSCERSSARGACPTRASRRTWLSG